MQVSRPQSLPYVDSLQKIIGSHEYLIHSLFVEKELTIYFFF